MTSYKKIFILCVLCFTTLLLASCKEGKEDKEGELNNEPPVDLSTVKEKPIVTITMEDNQQIILELEPSVAPNTVTNFVTLVEEGFYDGLIFHRVIPGFMIQGGDPLGNGTGGADYAIAGEFSSNGFDNKLKHERGVISMARAQDPNSASSQFFIMTEEATHLDGQYAAFGKVVEGMDVVDAIVNVERDAMDKPLQDVRMKKVEVDTKGFDYPKPVVQK